jgi:HAT1-interacting factor 1
MPDSSVPPSGIASTESTPTVVTTKNDADVLIAEGKKAIALKQWEEGVAKYADALDIM